jgi:four helix bundle protein
MPFEPLEEKRVYQRAEAVADAVWDLCGKWTAFAKQTVGGQLVRAADSIGANVAEAGGRFHPSDVCNFFYFARGSLYETRYWLRRAVKRGLITEDQLAAVMTELDQLAKDVNGCISFQRTRSAKPKPQSTPAPKG